MNDTDILVIMLRNMANLKSSSKIWMKVGDDNHQRVINVTQLYEQLGELICAALQAFHACTGCDYNPAFFRKGIFTMEYSVEENRCQEKIFD